MNKTYLMVPVKPVKHDLVSEIDKFIHVPLATRSTYGSVKVGDGLLVYKGVIDVDRTIIPTHLSQLQQDPTHRLVTESQMAYWDNKIDNSEVLNVDGSVVKYNSSEVVNDERLKTALNKYYTKTENDNLLNEKTDKTTTNVLTERVVKNETNIAVLTQNKAEKADIVDNLTTNNSNQMLSARQGYRLNNMINDINALLHSDNINLDSLQEIVDYIENNKDLIDSILVDKVNVSDVIDNLTTTDSTKPLSANQGVILKSFIDALPEWTKQPNKPTYYYSELLERPAQVRVAISKIGIPTKTSQLINDSNFITDEFVEDAISAIDYTGIEQRIDGVAKSIPTKVGQLENDKKYATETFVENSIPKDMASTEYVDTKIANLVDSAPETLNTLGELAESIKNNQDVIDALNESISKKADKTEIPKNVSQLNNDSNYATETFVENAIPNNFVTTNTNQYISGTKTFNKIDFGNTFINIGSDSQQRARAISIGGEVSVNGPYATSIGYGSQAGESGTAIGSGAQAYNNSTAIGSGAQALNNNIQLGVGQNLDEKTLQVFDYQLLNKNGKIPKERLPEDVNLATINKNIEDAENNSLKANDINSNRLIYGGYIENGVLIDNIEPKVITSLDEYVDNGYYVLPSKYVDNKVDKFYLYKVEGLLVPIKASLFITVADRYTTLISDNYIYDPQNMTVFGRNNTNLGDNSILGGDNNISASKNGITVGRNNYSNGESCFVTGTDNVADADCTAVTGTYNKSYANQGFVAGYNNKLLKGAYFSNSMGVGNINQGTGTSTNGGYNLAGSEYSSAEGLDNIAGGNVTYDGVELADINRYSGSTTYSAGTLVKRNGFVYKALTENTGVEPNVDKTLDNWEIIEPIVTEQYARASKASGEKCIAKNTGAFVHGYRLKSNRDYQTVVGKYNAEKTNAMFVVGTGAKGTPKNAFEVNDDSSVDINGKTTIKSTIDVAGQANIGGAVKISGSTTLNSTAVINGETTLKSKLHVANGNSSATLRHNPSGEFVIGGDGGIRLRPNGDTATAGGLAIKDGCIAPERSYYSDLGSSSSQFKSLYLSEDIFLGGLSVSEKLNGLDTMVGDMNTALESILGV